MAVSPEYNRGVVGLAASRLTEKYYRPSIVAQQMDEFTRGSCRSIPEFHITQALDQVADLLDHHGGHAAAAGFTIRNERLPEFTQKMRAIARQELGSIDLRPTLKADAELHLADLRPEIIRYLGWLQPTGIGNPQANFVTRDLRIRSRRAVGRDYSHLKLVVTDGSLVFDAIAFRQGYWIDQLPDRIDIFYTYEVNEFNGRTSLQLNVKDIKPSF
jgi:single-stranded-DNA-specific exonuclease